MTEIKTCWNVCCICWVNKEEQQNCSADDLDPGICRLSHLNLKSMLDVAKEMHATENETLPIKDTVDTLEEIKKQIKQNWKKNGSLPVIEKLDDVISKLDNR